MWIWERCLYLLCDVFGTDEGWGRGLCRWGQGQSRGRAVGKKGWSMEAVRRCSSCWHGPWDAAKGIFISCLMFTFSKLRGFLTRVCITVAKHAGSWNITQEQYKIQITKQWLFMNSADTMSFWLYHESSCILIIVFVIYVNLYSFIRHLGSKTLTLSHNHFMALFPGLPGWAGARRKTYSGLYGAREDNIGRHTNNLAGLHSIWTNRRPTFIFLHFYARCPSCRKPPNLSWLGTGTKYAGLHTQWLGLKTDVT